MQNNTIKLHDERNLGFSEYGNPEGIPLFLFHGTPGSRVFEQFENVPWIKEFGLHIITPERPGFGLSDPAPSREIKEWATDIEELADHLGINCFHVTGGSGGGPYAIACGIHSPERVLSVTPFSSGVPPEVPLSKDMLFENRMSFFSAKYAPFLLKGLFAISANGIKKRPKKYVKKMQSKMSEWDKHIIEKQKQKQRGEYKMLHLKEAFRQGVGGAYHDFLLVSHDWGLDLDKITVPVFLWHGTADTLMPVSSARKFSKLIPGCEPHFIKDAGHLLLGSEEIRSQMIDRMLYVGDQIV